MTNNKDNSNETQSLLSSKGVPTGKLKTNDHSAAVVVDIHSDDPYSLRQKKVSKTELNNIKRSSGVEIYNYYVEQNELIEDLLSNDLDSSETNESKISFLIQLSLVSNLVLVGLQLVAAILTNSLSLFATLADAFMDLLSSLIMFIVSLSNKKKSHAYPVGKTRMETVGLIIFASLMATVSFQLIISSLTSILFQNKNIDQLNLIAVLCVAIALLTKFVLYVMCIKYAKVNSNAKVLALDHRNDIYVNLVGLFMSFVGMKYIWILDPIGCLIVALIILRSWTSTAYEQMELIVGKSADTNTLKKLTYIACTHNKSILNVDTCRAYYAGNKMFVEIDVVMHKNTKLKDSHDIAEALQIKLEKLTIVERAFVHVDYESIHAPEH